MKIFSCMLLAIVGLSGSALAADGPSFKGEVTALDVQSPTELYEDVEYRFVGHGYGNRGADTPSVFAFHKRSKKWVRISEVATRDAVLGRSPDFSAVPLQVGWDHSNLKEKEYVAFPLITGAVLLPDKIEYDAEKQVYRLWIGSRYGEHSHPTVFLLRKRDLDACCEK